jgi:hypothetical protein
MGTKQLRAGVDRAGRQRPYAHFAIRAGLSVAALCLVVIPILFAFRLHENGLQVAPQVQAQPPQPSARDFARWRSAGARLPAHAAPVVLAYHDIRSAKAADGGFGRSSAAHNVTPGHFDQQLTMLQAAGYRSVTAAEYLAYLAGGALPSRSVLITFDGATQGLWIYADQILGRHHMHGVAFLNPTTIETNWTRHLSWPEVERMRGDGHWDLEAAVSAKTLSGGAGAVKDRMTAALRQSTQVFARHRLGVPRLFTWPAAAADVAPRPQGPLDARQIVRAPFAAAFVTGENVAPPASRRAGAEGLTSRISVSRSTEPDQLLATVASSTAIPVAGVNLLSDPKRWTMGVDDGSPVSISGKAVRFTYSGRYEEVAYAARATPDWDDYVIHAILGGLAQPRDNSASILVRVGSEHGITVRVSARSVTIVKTHGAGGAVLRRSPLLPAPVHDVFITVRPGRTLVAIDHLVTVTVPAPGGVRATGGVGLAAFRKSGRAAWPTFSALSVEPATSASTRSAGVQALPVAAASPPAAASLWVKNRFARASVRATAHTLRFTGAGIRDFAEYAPAQTSGWVGYAFSSTLRNLLPGESVGVYGRMGSGSQAVAMVSDHAIRVFSGPRSSRKLIASRQLTSSASHRITLRVLKRTTLVQADGVTVASVSARPGTAGGVGVQARRSPVTQPWPQLVGIAVTPVR